MEHQMVMQQGEEQRQGKGRRWGVHAFAICCLLHSAGSAAKAQENWWLLPVDGSESAFGPGDSESGDTALEDAVPEDAVPEDAVPEDAVPESAGRQAASIAAFAEALSGRGIRAVWGEEARRRFEEDISMPASQVSQNDIDEWVAHSRDAVRSLARADYERARQQLLEAQRLSQNAAEELNREVARARQVLDTCLFMVRAFLETNNRDDAERQARECRRLVPTIEPTQVRHTPDVRELLGRIDQALANEPPARLRVESDPAGCVVRVNGIEFGETPYLVDDLRPGNYRLQVECDPQVRGRVRRLRLGRGDTSVEVDAAFDAAFDSRPQLRLRAGASSAHLRTLASLVGGSVVTWRSTGEGIVLRRYDSQGFVSESVVSFGGDASPSADPHDWDGCIAELRERRGASPSESDSGAVGTPGVVDPGLRALREGSRGSGLRSAFGIGSLVLSAGSLVAGTLVWHSRGQRGDLYAIAEPGDVDFLQRQQRWRDLSLPVHLFAGAGFAFGLTGTLLLTRDVDGVPWWGWLGGALGVAAIATGAILIGTAPPCGNVAVDRQDCVDREQSFGLASLLFAGGGALASLPIGAALGRGGDARAEASVLPGGAYFGLRWRM